MESVAVFNVTLSLVFKMVEYVEYCTFVRQEVEKPARRYNDANRKNDQRSSSACLQYKINYLLPSHSVLCVILFWIGGLFPYWRISGLIIYPFLCNFFR